MKFIFHIACNLILFAMTAKVVYYTKEIVKAMGPNCFDKSSSSNIVSGTFHNQLTGMDEQKFELGFKPGFMCWFET